MERDWRLEDLKKKISDWYILGDKFVLVSIRRYLVTVYYINTGLGFTLYVLSQSRLLFIVTLVALSDIVHH